MEQKRMEVLAKLLIGFTLMTHAVVGIDFAKDVEGKDCKVIEPLRNYTFELGGLKRDLNSWIKSVDSPEQFSFNLCGPMSRKCAGQTAGACMKNAKGEETVIGITEKLYWNDGGLRFNFSDAKCNDKRNYTVNVLLHCDYSMSSNVDGVFHVGCDVNIVLKTQLACLPIPDNVKNPTCIIKSPEGTVYNFHPLRNANHVATIKGEQNSGKKFTIGICNPVLYGHEIACEPGTSVCQFDPKENGTNQYKNMGMQTQDFKFVGDQLLLSMTSNEPCNKTMNYTSEIHFECDPDGHNNDPIYHSTVNCKNIFSFATPVMCNNKKPCYVENVERNMSFDFSSLAGIQYEASNPNNTKDKIKFSICSEAGDPCMKNTGSCIVRDSQSTQAGKTNADLKLAADMKSPYLSYTDGAICGRQGKKYSTKIDFICADNNSTDEGPVAIEDGCDITIHFKTILACNFIKNCIGKDLNGEEIDLRPLIDFDGNYEAKVNKNLPENAQNYNYLLNVCRPLNSKYSLNCRGTSGACRTKIDNGKHENEMSLGHPEYSLSVQNSGDTKEVTMKYFEGAVCETDKDENFTTKIRFYCDEKAGLGNPILDNINGCQYEFDFPTNILCNERPIDLESKNKSCNLYNNALSVSVDLKLFGNDGKFKVGDTSVDICGGNEKKFYTVVYKQSLVRIEFSQTVGGESVDVEVRLKCSANNRTTTENGHDGILVVHEGSLICSLLKIAPKATPDITPTPKPDDHHDTNPDESSSGLALGYVFLISIVIVAFVAFYLVIRNPERREIIRNLIKFRSTSNVQYTRNVNDDDFILN